MPPCRAPLMRLRERLLLPSPHDLLHVLHAVQSPTRQSTGHVVRKHAIVCDTCAHAAPPKWASRTMLRVCVCSPSPQLVEHLLQPVKTVISQSIGHAPVPHARVWRSSGQVFPPNAASTLTLRSCCCVPPPHVSEQGVHAPNGVTSQSMGHGWLLQGNDSMRTGHCLPPNFAGVIAARARFL